MIVVPTGRTIWRNHIVAFPIVDVVRRGICGERLRPISHGNNGIIRPNSPNHLPVGTKMINVRSVLVTDPESAVFVDDDTLRIDWDSLCNDGIITTSKAVTGVRGYGKIWKSFERDVTLSISIQTSCRLAIPPSGP